jgi:hypothetical protein
MKTAKIAAAQSVEYREDIAAASNCAADVAARAKAEGGALLCFPESPHACETGMGTFPV